ncbi:hypothetical protein C9374_005302 [Naegleria lovaniensis]|uniref:Uncharacterized protein n=1 Tax=Naegleria lovaniensis TaxID=51637 RepID=A0AA88GQM3_NAELO|nr:uncharacterized protein C9374_005302 [Naegleria lovaniensis]KAG2382722.1 hypothetical protein C9374_005302 [Naegleria lovaniensis]
MQQNGANNSQPAGVSNFTEASPASSNNNNATSPLPPPRKLTEASSSASITSARGANQYSEVGSTLGTSKDYSSLAAFNSFLNNSVFPIEDLHNVSQAWKPPEKNNIPVSSNQKGSSVFSRFTKRVNVRFKGKTFLEMPSYPFVNSDNEAEPISSKSPTNAGTRSKPSSASGKRPNSSSKKTQQPNNNTTTSSNTSQLEDDNIPKLWEHRFVYFLVSNYQGNTGQTEMHHTLIESQDFLIEKEHCIVFETLQDLVYYESSPFISFLIRREFDPSLPASSVAEKKKNGQTNTQKKDAAAKKDNAPPPPGLPTPSTTKKIQTAISAATSINQDELIESMVHDIKSSFGSNCEILHTFKTCTMPLFVNDKFGFTKAKYEQKQSIKYKNWSSLLCKSDNTLNIAAPTLLMDDSFKSETPSSSRFSITQLPNTNETSEILNHINVRIEVAEGTSILSEEVQNKLNPVLISISSLKDLPNEKYLAERCKPVSLSFNIRGKTFRTNGYEHASFISLNYKRIIYLGSNSEMEMYREYFSRIPIVFEVHDRDPKEGVGKFFGKAEVSLKTMILNSRGREVSDNFQIQGVCMLQDEYEKAVKRLEEEKKRVQAIEEEKKAKASSKSPKNKNSKTNLLESPKVALASANTKCFKLSTLFSKENM